MKRGISSKNLPITEASFFHRQGFTLFRNSCGWRCLNRNKFFSTARILNFLFSGMNFAVSLQFCWLSIVPVVLHIQGTLKTEKTWEASRGGVQKSTNTWSRIWYSMTMSISMHRQKVRNVWHNFYWFFGCLAVVTTSQPFHKCQENYVGVLDFFLPYDTLSSRRRSSKKYFDAWVMEMEWKEKLRVRI